MQRTTILAAAALVAGITITTGALAAQATGSVNVRSGPSTSYSVVDTLSRGETVAVRECSSNGWCYITHPGPDGWVSARYLSETPTVQRSSPSVSFSFSFGRGDGFSVGRPVRGGSRDLVCLVTFNDRDQVAAGRDADVRRAQVMSRAEAERRDGPNDRQGIFDYGTNAQTRDTCRYLDRLN